MKDLRKIRSSEWEKICKRCGKCCLLKLEDEDSGEVYYTNVVCRYFDEESGSCTVYEQRCELVPECLKLTPDNISTIQWMPRSCAYRALLGNQPSLPPTSIKGRCISEAMVDPENLEDYIVDWDDL